MNGTKNEIREMNVPVWGESVLKGMKEYKRAQDEWNKIHAEFIRLAFNMPKRKGIFTDICE
jgi:hypothetical protein